MKCLRLLVFLCPGLLMPVAHADDACDEPSPACLHDGARIFIQRCSLCHGSDGYGEGILPISIRDYPSTNLLDADHAKTRKELVRLTEHGASLENVEDRMPPWKDELTAREIGAVTAFVYFLQQETASASSMLKQASAQVPASAGLGRILFRGRCALCHGEHGKGDGVMARLITSPPPYNLTLSRQPDAYLSEIIHKGGERMARSRYMPPFGDDLSETEIRSIILYLKTLRKANIALQ